MKNLKNITALILTFALVISTMAACKSAVNNFTTEDVIDSSETQQRWLKMPDSKLVINPDAISGTDTGDAKNQPISLGLEDENGNIIKTLNDVLFFAEKKSANAIGGEVLYTADFATDTTIWKALGKLTNNSSGSNLDVVAPESVSTTAIISRSPIQNLDLDGEPLYLVIEAVQCAGPLKIGYIANSPQLVADIASIDKPGTYIYNIQKLITDNVLGTRKINFNITFSTPGAYKLTSFQIKKLAPGVQLATEKAFTTWAPYYMSSSTTYPNGTTIEAVDSFYDANTISRKATCMASGEIALAGKIYGTAEFDAKNNMVKVEGDGYRYVVLSKRKGDIKFYKTEADFLAETNSSDDPAGAEYWALFTNALSAEDSFFTSVAASSTLSFDELKDTASDATTTTKTKKVFNDLLVYWDEYIAANDVSEYIINVPEK